MNRVRIISGRGTGKTKQLLNEAAKNHGTVICANPNAMWEKAKAYGIYGCNFVSYYDFINADALAPFGNFYIDELENLIAATKTNKTNVFKGYTLSNED